MSHPELTQDALVDNIRNVGKYLERFDPSFDASLALQVVTFSRGFTSEIDFIKKIFGNDPKVVQSESVSTCIAAVETCIREVGYKASNTDIFQLVARGRLSLGNFSIDELIEKGSYAEESELVDAEIAFLHEEFDKEKAIEKADTAQDDQSVAEFKAIDLAYYEAIKNLSPSAWLDFARKVVHAGYSSTETSIVLRAINAEFKRVAHRFSGATLSLSIFAGGEEIRSQAVKLVEYSIDHQLAKPDLPGFNNYED